MKIVFISSTSACFELNNKDCYYAKQEYEVFVNGEKQARTYKENVFSVFGLQPDSEYTVKALGKEVVFRTEKETACIDVKKNGAVGDGIADDTIAIQACIEACEKGGRVYVPAGTYLISPLTLKSNMTLELAENAVLLGRTEVEKYVVFPGAIVDEKGKTHILRTWQGDVLPARGGLLMGYRLENVRVIGRGIIDGNAQNSTWWTEEKKRNDVGRPRLVFLNDCKHVVFHGVTGKNSPSWTFHPFLCDDVSFYDISAYSPEKGANPDGLDPEGCDGVNIIGCRFSTGDDCIAIKSGRDELAAIVERPAIRHTIRNCLMQNGHGAVVLGSESSYGIRDLCVSQCMFEGTGKGLRIKTRRGRGKKSVVDGIVFENIKMDGVVTPLVINMYYLPTSHGEEKNNYFLSREIFEADDKTPYVGSIGFKNIECRNCVAAAGYFDGLSEQPIKSVELENVHFHFDLNATPRKPASQLNIQKRCRCGLYFDYVKDIKIKNVSFENVDGDEVIATNYSSCQRD